MQLFFFCENDPSDLDSDVTCLSARTLRSGRKQSAMLASKSMAWARKQRMLVLWLQAEQWAQRKIDTFLI